jgi:predicted acyl esterase
MAQSTIDLQKVMPTPPKLGRNPMIAKTFKVPMRDGAKLAIDLYFPEGEGPWPVILQRTPYSRRTPYMVNPYGLMPDAGYVYAVQDCRGRFDSEGVYRPFLDDMEDGYDTIEWLAAQPWSSGKVGMMGASAMGITTYMAAMAQTPHLAAGYVSVCRNPSQTLSRFPGGILLENGAGGWEKLMGIDGAAPRVPHIATWTDDDVRVDMRRYYSKISIPMMHIGGWYDIHSQPLIDAYAGLQEHGAPGARGRQKLVMNAAAHVSPVKGATFPNDPSGPWQSPDRAIRWFDHWLKGADNGVEREPTVRYYLMGDFANPAAPGNRWREAEAWPPASTPLRLYLQPNGGLAPQAPGQSGSRDYAYDPYDAVPTLGGNNLAMDSGPMDQRPVSRRPDVLRFVGEPLSAPLEVAGHVFADLWVSTDAEDTDVIVKLVDIHPDGFEALVHDQGLRLRHRNGLESQARVTPGEVYPIRVDLWSTALVFDKGHRIAVLIQSSNWPRFERHANTWEPVASYAQAVKAKNTIHFGGSRASALVLPAVESEPG